VLRYKSLIAGIKLKRCARGGLEPHFRVLFSAVFHGVASGNCHQSGKWRILAEAKLLQTAASLLTLFALVISSQPLQSPISCLGIFELGMRCRARGGGNDESLCLHLQELDSERADPPAPPMTKTRLTLTGSAPASRNIASQAVIAPIGRLAAAVKESASGMAATIR
jgi:hypothetical protein